jgi:hypothetical protein
VTHKKINRFQLDGVYLDDSRLLSARLSAMNVVVSKMRDSGYVPMLDVDPAWSTNLNENGTYSYLLTVHGVYLGKRRAKAVYGVSGGREVMMA